MKNYILLPVLISISMIGFDKMNAQNNLSENAKNQVTEYFFISVDFYSIGQGIDLKAQNELFDQINRTQKEFKVIMFYERIHWGKEGEETIYIDLSNLPIGQRMKFVEILREIFRIRDKMSIVHSNLYFEPAQKYLMMGISLFGQIETRENALLDYIAKWEKRSQLKINHCDMINETAIPEDQDRRIELNLSGLENPQIMDIVNKAQEIMKVKLPDVLEVDFIGIGGANDRAFKAYLRAFISQFEKENKLKIGYDSRIYEMKNGGELFSIQLYNLDDELKYKFVEEVNKMFAGVSYIRFGYF